jgi:asparagine synthase (glutamine-hydrolysing)
LIYENNTIKIISYWKLSFGELQRDRGERYYIERLKDLFFNSVKLRLASDVPLGAFLSGGVDSSTVVAAMVKLGVSEVKTFTIGFDNEEYSEIPYAREVADFLGTKHQELIVKPETTELLPELVWFFDEPFADSSAVPTYYVSKLARSEVTVALSGDGGDELFAGYRRYRDPLLAKAIQRLPEPLRINLFNKMATCLPEGIKGARFLTHCTGSAFEYYASKINYFDANMKSSLYCPDFREMIAPSLPLNWLRAYFDEFENTSILCRRQYTDIRTYLVDTILTKVDRASMASSLEARAPFLDYRIVEFAGLIPDHYKIRNNGSKHLLKKMARDILPAGIVDRKKKGFSIPKHIWIRDQLKEFATDVILSSTAKNRGYFNLLYVQSLLHDHFSGKKDNSDQIWALLCLELWHLKFLDKQGV